MIVRRLARPMLAAVFVSGGIDTLRNPGPRVQMAANLPLEESPIPGTAEQLTKVDAAVKVVAGLLLATNRVPRLAALTLAGSMVPTTLAGHRFWEVDDKAQRRNQFNHFMKNLGLTGGLLIASVDTEGKESVGHRIRRKMPAVDA